MDKRTKQPAINTTPFSQTLHDWLHSPGTKTVGSLQDIVAEKSFAIVFLVLMAVPALPVPTGGITHVLEVVVLLLVGQLLLGRHTVWLPHSLRQRPLGSAMLHKALPKLVSLVRWLERFSRPRLARLLVDRNFLRVAGLIVGVFTLAAFLSPPFSGLDTLPSMGIVLLATGLILEDIVLFMLGVVVGSAGIAVSLTLGTAIITFIKHLV